MLILIYLQLPVCIMVTGVTTPELNKAISTWKSDVRIEIAAGKLDGLLLPTDTDISRCTGGQEDKLATRVLWFHRNFGTEEQSRELDINPILQNLQIDRDLLRLVRPKLSKGQDVFAHYRAAIQDAKDRVGDSTETISPLLGKRTSVWEFQHLINDKERPSTETPGQKTTDEPQAGTQSGTALHAN